MMLDHLLYITSQSIQAAEKTLQLIGLFPKIEESPPQFLGEGFAQWTMAISGVVALLLSAWAVILLKKTLAATEGTLKSANETIQVTRSLGEAQLRAYLYLKVARYKIFRDRIALTIEIGNAGHSPASFVRAEWVATLREVGGPRKLPRVLTFVESETQNEYWQPITANSTSIEETQLHFEHLKFDEYRDYDFKTSFMICYNYVDIDILIKWCDVFGKMHEIPVYLSANIDAAPDSLKKKRSTHGVMDFRSEDARFEINHKSP